jgi:uncharacterized membrane protein YraQ (UPF0718 family)
VNNSIFLVLLKSADTLGQLGPYGLGGVLVGEVLRLASWKNLFLPRLNGLTRRNPIFTTVGASILGTVSPLCTYGTIPIVLQLFKLGTPLSFLLTFLATSSLMNPQLFVMTWGGLGLKMAVVRTLAVLAFGVILGLVASRLDEEVIVNTALTANSRRETGLEEQAVTADEDSSEGVKQSDFVGREGDLAENTPFSSGECRVTTDKRPYLKELLRGYWGSLQFIGFYFLLGTLLGAMVEVFIPKEWMMLLFKPGKWWSITFAAFLGMPLYACGGGTIPLVRSLMQEGMTKGAALAFFLVGPATRITPLVSLTTIIRPLFLSLYVGLLVTYSIVVGFIYG